MATKRMDEDWANMKTHIRSIWGEELTDDVLKPGRKDLKKMVNIIHENTGKPRAEIRMTMGAFI